MYGEVHFVLPIANGKQITVECGRRYRVTVPQNIGENFNGALTGVSFMMAKGKYLVYFKEATGRTRVFLNSDLLDIGAY